MEFHWAENLDENFRLLVLELGESRSLFTMGDILYLIHTVLLSVSIVAQAANFRFRKTKSSYFPVAPDNRER